MRSLVMRENEVRILYSVPFYKGNNMFIEVVNLDGQRSLVNLNQVADIQEDHTNELRCYILLTSHQDYGHFQIEYVALKSALEAHNQIIKL